jgi:hypothetical protein
MANRSILEMDRLRASDSAQASVDKVVVQVGAVLQVAEGRANVAADTEYTVIPVRPFEEAV